MRILLGLLFCFHYQHAFALGKIEIQVDLAPTGSFVATSRSLRGHAAFIKAKLKSTKIEVDTSSFETGIALRNEHFRHRLQYEKYPVASLDEIKLHGDFKTGNGSGLLFVRGHTEKIQFSYQIEDQIIRASFLVSAKKFGIKNVAYMGVGVRDKMKVVAYIPLVNLKLKNQF